MGGCQSLDTLAMLFLYCLIFFLGIQASTSILIAALHTYNTFTLSYLYYD